jgi:nicotinic acid mononucleotide adenylyltransferase
MENCHILVASRPGLKALNSTGNVFGLFNGDSPYRLGKIKNKTQEFIHRGTGKKLVVYDISPRDISSSVVRERLVLGESVDNLLPPEVEAYIIGHQIYKIGPKL